MLPAVGGILQSSAFVGAYDDIPDLVHLYEIARRGLTAYTGPLVRIRRSTDSVQQDFGYVENTGLLDTAAIAAFIGGGSGFVVTIYDQVGSTNPTQATASLQPLYVASGQGGKPTMRFSGDYLQAAFSGALSQPFNVYSAAVLTSSPDDGSSRYMVESDDATNRMGVGKGFTGSPDRWLLNAGTAFNGTLASNNDFGIWAVLFNGASSQFWINAVSQGTGNAGAHNADGITIGAYSAGSNGWIGDIAMVAIADPSHDNTERAAMETAVSDFYNEVPAVEPYFFFDVSSVAKFTAVVNTGVILSLENGSTTATVRWRNFEAGTWYDLDKTIELSTAFVGTTRDIAIISDIHFGLEPPAPTSALTAAVDDIDDNIGTCTHVLVLGDICNDVNEYAEYKTVKATSDIDEANWHELGGNHDFPVLASFLSELGYALPYNEVVIDNLVFLMTSPDSDSQTLGATQLSWLYDRVAANSGNPIILCVHQGIQNTTRETDQSTGYIKPPLTLTGISAVFCGHSHGYSDQPAPSDTNAAAAL